MPSIPASGTRLTLRIGGGRPAIDSALLTWALAEAGGYTLNIGDGNWVDDQGAQHSEVSASLVMIVSNQTINTSWTSLMDAIAAHKATTGEQSVLVELDTISYSFA